MKSVQIMAEVNGKAQILIPNGSADPRKIVVTVMKAANMNPKVGTHEEHAKLAETILASATSESMLELNGVKFLFAFKKDAKQKVAETKPEDVKPSETKPASETKPDEKAKVQPAKMQKLREPVAQGLPLPAHLCVACRGSAVNSKGFACSPCNGTGVKTITAIGSGTPEKVVANPTPVPVVVQQATATVAPTVAKNVPELLKCSICKESLIEGVLDTVETKEHGTVHRACLTKMVRIHSEVASENRRKAHEAYIRGRSSELERMFDETLSKEVAKRKLGTANVGDIIQPYSSPQGKEECFLCNRRVNTESHGTIWSPVQANGEKIYVHRHCLLRAMEQDASRNTLITYEAWGLRLSPEEVNGILALHAAIQEGIAEILRKSMSKNAEVKVLIVEHPEVPLQTVEVATAELESMPSAAMLGTAETFKASTARIYEQFKNNGLIRQAPTANVEPSSPKGQMSDEEFNKIMASL